MLSMHDPLASWHHFVQPPSVDDFLSILHDCRTSRNLGHAKYVQMHILNNGLEAHEALGNHLVSILMRCGSLAHAEQTFRRLVHPSEYSWTSLIQGYTDGGDPQHALDLFQRMQEECVHPSSHTFVAVLKACARLKHLGKGQQLHAELIKEALEGEHFVGNMLVDMYAKCGSLVEAQEVFDRLLRHDVVSWSALIGGYTDHGLAEEALNCLEQMQLEDVQADAVTFVCCLKACSSVGAIGRAQEIHAQIAKDGFEKQSFIGNILVDMYARYGFFAEAHEVFNELQARDSISWTALITGYADHGLGEEALNCLEQMQSEGMCPDAVTFICSLKACASTGAIDKGQFLYGEIVKWGFERDRCVGSALVDMYAKCGVLLEAQEVFDELPVQDLVLWNTILVAYVEHRNSQKALNCLEQMQVHGVSPNTVTYVSCLKASSCIRAIDKGREIHADIAKEGYETDPFLVSSLMDMYAKSGSLVEAREVFDEVQVQDVVLWNTLITGYAQHGLGDEVLQCLKRMQLESVSPDAVTFVCSLQACEGIEAIDKAREIHIEIAKEGFENDLVVGNALVDMYAKGRSLAEAWETFENLSLKDVISWNAIILGYVEQGESPKALQLYAQMQEQGLSPDRLTFTSILKACGNTAAIETGKKIHVQTHQVNALDDDELLLGAALIDMYSKCGSMVNAQQVFDGMPERDLVRWTALINGYARQGDSELVFEMFERMVEEGIEPNEITFLSVLVACSQMGLLDKGKKYYEAMSQNYGINPTIKHQNCMVDLFGRVSQLDEAVAMLETSSLQPNRVTWSSVLGACKKWGNIRLSRQAFEHAVKSDDTHAAAFVLMSNIYADGHMFQDAEKVA